MPERPVGRRALWSIVLSARVDVVHRPESRIDLLVTGRHRFSERSAPGRRGEGVGEVLGLVHDEAFGELHDADREGRHPVIGDHALAHPDVIAAQDPAGGEVAFGRMPAACAWMLDRPLKRSPDCG